MNINSALKTGGLWCILALPLVFFDINQTISLTLIKSCLLFIACGLLVLGEAKPSKTILKNRILLFSFALLLVGAVYSAALSSSPSLTLFGAENQWFGLMQVCMIIAASLFITPALHLKHLHVAYIIIVILAIGSIVIDFQNLMLLGLYYRVGGLSLQPTVLGPLLGVGIILGQFLSRFNTSRRLSLLLCSQTILVLVLLLTQTRAAILMLVPWLIYDIITHRKQYSNHFGKYIKAILGIGISYIAFIVLYFGSATRLDEIQKIPEAILYRFDLYSHSISLVEYMPFWGFGPGKLTVFFTSFSEAPERLHETLYKYNETFSSSHNIFIDKLIEYGWLVFIAYVLLAAYALFAVYRNRSDKQFRYFGFAYVFMLAQLSVTVPRIDTELCYWLLLVICSTWQEKKHAFKKTT